MSFNNIRMLLTRFTKSELILRDYYFAQQDPAKLEVFLSSLTPEKSLVLDGAFYANSCSPTAHCIRDETYFSSNSERTISFVKHARYAPAIMHSHIFFEMFYVLEGRCEQSFGGKPIELHKGDFCLISPHTTHAISVFSDDTIVLNILIRRSTFEENFFDFLKRDNELSFFFFNSIYTHKLNEYILFHTGANKEIEHEILSMYSEFNNNLDYCDKILNNMLVILLTKLLRGFKNNMELPPQICVSETRNQILHHMQKHFETTTLPKIAKHFNYSPTYTSKLIKDTTGYTFTQLLQKIRLERAASLLVKTNLPVASIGNNVGYPSTEHFIRLFRKKYGLSPTEYRKRERTLHLAHS